MVTHDTRCLYFETGSTFFFHLTSWDGREIFMSEAFLTAFVVCRSQRQCHLRSSNRPPFDHTLETSVYHTRQ